jgi:hypothetical protein
MFVAALAACTLTAPVLAAEMPATPYAGQQTRTIKALSDDEIAALRNGEGMGMAKAAELNGYPGPIHVLALAAQLGLTESQHQEVTAIFERMSAAAKLLGGELIARERTLDQLFATGEVTPNRLSAETAAIGELQGRLRSVHLAAHLQIRALMRSPSPTAQTCNSMIFRPSGSSKLCSRGGSGDGLAVSGMTQVLFRSLGIAGPNRPTIAGRYAPHTRHASVSQLRSGLGVIYEVGR